MSSIRYSTRAGIVFLALFCFLGLAGVSSAQVGRLDPEWADSLAQLTDDPLEKADLYSRAWLDDKAIEVLEASGREDAETLWRLARSRIDKGENLEGDDALALYEQALTEAERAVELEPDNALAQQTLATAIGRVALFKGIFKSVGLVKRVHKAALKAVALGDSMPVALYVLGRTHKELIKKPGIIRGPLGLGWAKADSVTYYFDKALEVSGGNMIQCRVEYAEFLYEKKKDPQAAKEMIEAALVLPLRDEQDPKAIKRALDLLDEIEKE